MLPACVVHVAAAMDGVTLCLGCVVYLCRRFVRCIKVVCCQQSAYADANKVLFSKRLKIMKVGTAIATQNTQLLCPKAEVACMAAICHLAGKWSQPTAAAAAAGAGTGNSRQCMPCVLCILASAADAW
jgi:hypothetical protein